MEIDLEYILKKFIKSGKMTTKEQTIQRIIERKFRPDLNYSLKSKTEKFTTKLYYTLFDSNECVEQNIEQLEIDFSEIYQLACRNVNKNCVTIWNEFLKTLPEIFENLSLDGKALIDGDPASNTIEEVYLAYPGFYAIAIYRFSHELHLLNVPLIPRLMSEYAHSKTGTDIHPGATIGKSFFIDHATGIVIGETCIIKNNVKIYQGVTLGALYVSKELKNTKRHPTVESNVTIYANATILGGKTNIGKNSIIGGNVWITESIPKNSMVFHKPEIILKQNKDAT